MDGVRHIAEDECDANVAARTHLPRGFIRDSLTFSCFAGGMITATAKGLISLPHRLWDTGKRFASQTATGIGEALADVPFYAMEGAGYGQMASGVMATFKGSAALPVNVPGGPGIGGINGAAAVGVLECTPAIAMETSTAGIGTVAVPLIAFYRGAGDDPPSSDNLELDTIMAELEEGLTEMENRDEMAALVAEQYRELLNDDEVYGERRFTNLEVRDRFIDLARRYKILDVVVEWTPTRERPLTLRSLLEGRETTGWGTVRRRPELARNPRTPRPLVDLSEVSRPPPKPIRR